MANPLFGTQIRGIKSGPTGRSVLAEEANRVTASRISRLYENHEFTLASPVANFNLATDLNHVTSCSCGRSAFGLIARTDRTLIRNRGSAVIGVRFNDLLEDIVTIEDGENLDWDFEEVFAIFLTNASGVGQPIRITLG